MTPLRSAIEEFFQGREELFANVDAAKDAASVEVDAHRQAAQAAIDGIWTYLGGIEQTAVEVTSKVPHVDQLPPVECSSLESAAEVVVDGVVRWRQVARARPVPPRLGCGPEEFYRGAAFQWVCHLRHPDVFPESFDPRRLPQGASAVMFEDPVLYRLAAELVYGVNRTLDVGHHGNSPLLPWLLMELPPLNGQPAPGHASQLAVQCPELVEFLADLAARFQQPAHLDGVMREALDLQARQVDATEQLHSQKSARRFST
jgi:hypothetical protein